MKFYSVLPLAVISLTFSVYDEDVLIDQVPHHTTVAKLCDDKACILKDVVDQYVEINGITASIAR